MKHSIARKVTQRIFLLLLAALAALFIGSFVLVSRVVNDQYREHALAIVTVYSDLVAHIADLEDVPVDLEHADLAIYYGDYMCTWYNIDYAYMYVPDVEKDTITYIAVSYDEENRTALPEDHLVGYVVERPLSPEELAVWNGEQVFARIRTDHGDGREMSTVLRIEDTFGHRMLAGVDVNYDRVYGKIIHTFGVTALGIMAVIVCVYFAIYAVVRKRVSQPAQQVSRAMQDFITDGKRSSTRLAVNSQGDEFAMMAEAFNSMTENIDNYLEDIRTLTGQQEHQKTELDIAARIQKGFLPEERFSTPYCEVRAVMTPAKDVGGDLYDYIPLDDHRLLAVIADVSGKGIAASIYMAVILMLIREFAKMGLSPAEILKKTNDTLSEKNAALLFTTVFVAVYDSESGTLTYANAGHNPPYLIGRDVHRLDGASGTLLGLFAGETYPQATVPLHPGETLFLYTDGVNEATDDARQFFGTARLEQVLRSHRDDPVTALSAAVHAFTGQAEPHDDVTMLALTARETTEMQLDVDVREMTKVKAAILALPIPRPQQLALCLAAEECFVNICSYAFEDGVPPGEKVEMSLTVSDRVTLQFKDGGQPFDPVAGIAAAPADYDIDTQIGGLGTLLASSAVDEMTYEYQENKNVLTLIKYIKEEEK